MPSTCARWMCLGAMCLLLGISTGAFAATELACPRVGQAPLLDARLEDWPALPQVVLAAAKDWHPAAVQFADYGGPDDISAEIWLGWDKRAFYLALQIRDDVLVRARSIAEVDQGDSVVLSFVTDDPEEVNEFVVAPLRAAYPVYRSEPAARSGEVRTVNVAMRAPREERPVRRVVYEVAIPWSEVPPIRAALGQRFALTVSVCDDDGAGLEGCLEIPLSMNLSVTGVAVEPPPEQPPPAPVLPPTFPAPEVARFDSQCFTLRGEDTFLFGGEIEYSRLPKHSWAERIRLLQAANMNLVGVTVPWHHHQPTPRDPDLSSLSDFLALCRLKGVWVQLNLGPYAGERWEAGGVPAWVSGLQSSDSKWTAVERWYEGLLAVVKQHQATAGGAVVSVLIRPLPDRAGKVEAAALERLVSLVAEAGVQVPLMTTNASAARANTKQNLANLLDTLSFYSPTTADELLAQLRTLGQEENGPAVIAALPHGNASPESLLRSADLTKLALAHGAKAIVIADFAPGLGPGEETAPDGTLAAGVIDPAGARASAYPELRLTGSLLHQFGAQLARAIPSEDAAQADDQRVKVAARLADEQGFLFLWDDQGQAAHHVRLTFTEPGTGEQVSIPEAGAIVLPPGGVKIILTGLPVGRGVLRYTTSEVLGITRAGERTMLVVYGDPDTPGEISLRWPGPPLVSGEVAREHWDPETKTFVLDYYHGHEDRYLLVDELQIAILPRARAARAATVAGPEAEVTLTVGAEVAAGALWPDKLEAELDCPEGTIEASAALPHRPSAVLVDGKPVDFRFTAPDRVVRFSITTQSFEQERGPASLWERLGRAIGGGPPQLHAEFDRGSFMPDAISEGGAWQMLASSASLPDELALAGGDFVRLRSLFDPAGRTRMTLAESTDPALVFVNNTFVPELSGTAPKREADLSGVLLPGENSTVIVLHLLSRARGREGLYGAAKRLPAVSLGADSAALPLESWEISVGLPGEAAGWQTPGLDLSRWHFIRFGPWRNQGSALADFPGVGWYRVPFGLPRSREWRIPYYLKVSLTGTAALYLNGARLATCRGDGSYRVPLPEAQLSSDQENLLAAAIYGFTEETGLRRVEIEADQEQMTKRRALEIRF